MILRENISIVQNFVCTSDSRKQMIADNLPQMAKIFDDVSFHINYNTSINLQEMQELYQKNIKNLNFEYSDSRDWGLDTLKLLENVTTPYVMYLCEDFEYRSKKSDWENLASEALVKNNVDFVMLAKIEKYSQQMWNRHYEKSGEHCRFYNSKNSPSKVLSIDAIYRKDFLFDRLTEYTNLYSHHLPNNYETYYKNQNGIRRFSINCAIPKNILLYSHPRHVSVHEAKDSDLSSGEPYGKKEL